MLGVGVLVDNQAGTGQKGGVDDRRMVEAIAEDDVARPREGPDRAEIREVAGAEQDGGLGALPGG
jgi:hypothetical protein